MIIYFILIAYIFLLSFVLKFIIPDYQLRQKWIAFLGVSFIFLIFALKAPSVGVDIKGYQEQYYISKYMSWSNYDYVFFENGYIFLEKLFSKLGFSFQLFTALIYLTECAALYLMVSRFSQDAMMSLLIFICYLTFVFSMSGLRQVLAMSLCIFAYFLFYKRKPIPIIFGYLVIAVAVTIHTSAYVFCIIPLVMLYCDRFPGFSPLLCIVLLLLSVFGRAFVWKTIDAYVKNVDAGTAITLGGNFLFLLGITFFCLFTYETYYGLGFFGTKSRLNHTEIVFEDTMCLRIAELCVFGEIIFSGASLLRTVNYFILLLVPLLPGMLFKYRKDQRIVLQVALIVFLLFLFYTQTLAVNQLGISHYKFFWEST